MAEAEFEHLAGLGDGARDGFHQPLGDGQAHGQLGQAGVLIGDPLEAAAQVAGGDERVVYVEQILRFQHTAARGQLHVLADVMRPADGQIVDCEQLARFGRPGQTLDCLVEVGGGLQGARQLGRCGEVAEIDQTGEDLREFEDLQCFLIHEG